MAEHPVVWENGGTCKGVNQLNITDSRPSLIGWRGFWRYAIPSKFQHCPKPKHGRILQQLSRIDAEGIGGAATGMDKILKVRLQGPARTHFILIDDGRQRFETAQGPVGSHQLLEVDIEGLSAG